MKLLTLCALLAAAAWAPATEPKDPFYPKSFASREAAKDSAHHLFAGGDVDVVRVGNKMV